MRRRARLAALLAPLLAGLGGALPAEAQIGQPEVHEVRFEGNRTFSSDSLARAIVTRQTECKSFVFNALGFCLVGADWAMQRHYLRPRSLPLDQIRLQVYYDRRGYPYATVDTATTVRSDGGVEILFRVTEGRPVLVREIDIMGAEQVEVRGLLRNLPLRVGDPLSDITLQATQDTLQRRLRNEGYAHAEVLKSSRIARQTPFEADVSYDVAPGVRSRYGHVDVNITGVDGDTVNTSLNESTVLKILQFRSGDLFRENQVYEAQARLYGLEITRSARLELERGFGLDSVVPVTVTVQESDAHRVRAGSGWSTAGCFDVESRWVSRNFRGGGRRLQIRGRLSNILAPQFHDILCPELDRKDFQQLNWLLTADFNQPWIFSTRNSFAASLFGERQSIPDAFIREAVGLSLALTRNIGPRTPLTVSFRPELSRLDAAEVLFCTSFLVCSPRDIARLQGANLLSPVGINFARNRSNNILNPTRGYTTVLDIEHAAPWTGSDFRYDRIIADAAVYEQVVPGFVLAGRLRTGWVGAGAFGEFKGSADPEGVHPQKQFYAGGANSVRGFAQNRLGPVVLTADAPQLLSADGAGCMPGELIDLSCDAGGMREDAFFPRATGGTRVLEGSMELRFPLASRLQGAAFADVGQVWGASDDITLSSLEITPGLGVRLLSPIGPLRLDVAYRSRGGSRVPVVTSQIRPFVAGQDSGDDRITVDGNRLEYVSTGELVILEPLVLFGESPRFSLSRFQLHISIGQAF